MKKNRTFYVHLAILALLFVPGLVGAQEYVPLTTAPGIKEAANTNNLPDFFNSMYKIAVGAAAVIAVLQLVRAGVLYMMEGSVVEKREAKHIIAMSLWGLLLVLAPYIVFGIIDPRILSLQIGVDKLENLGSPDAGNGDAGDPGDTGTPADDGDDAAVPDDDGSAPAASGNGTFQVTPGTFVWASTASIASTPSCLGAYYGTGTTQAECEANHAAFRNAIPDDQFATNGSQGTPEETGAYIRLMSCTAPANGQFSIPQANVCPQQPHISH